MDIRQYLTSPVVNGGSGASGLVAYWSDASTITANSTFSFDGTTMQARGVTARYDNNGATRIIIRNDDAGASAFTQLKLVTDAGDFNVTANSTAAGDSVSITADSTFGGGMDVGILGANALRFRTAGTAWLTIGGTGLSTFTNNVTIDSSGGPHLTVKDGGTFGTNADPHLQFEDSVGSGGRIGFTDGASKDFKFQNQTNTGLFDFITSATQIAGSAGAATGTYWTFKLGGTTYKLALLAES